MICPDANVQNADWTKQSWDLPPYKSPEFLGLLERLGMTLEQFKELPVYHHAVRTGKIVNDIWVSK